LLEELILLGRERAWKPLRWPRNVLAANQTSECSKLFGPSQFVEEGAQSDEPVDVGRASGSQTRRIFFPMSMTCKERPSYDISIHALKYALATLVQGVASALRHQLFEQASHGFYSIHQMIQLRELSLRERSPAFRRASDIAESKEQMADFTQGKTELTRTLNDCQPVKRCGVVSSLPAHSRGARKQSDSLVVPNRRCLEPNLSSHLGNRQFWHKDILAHPFPINIRMLDRFFTKNPCLKVDFKL